MRGHGEKLQIIVKLAVGRPDSGRKNMKKIGNQDTFVRDAEPKVSLRRKALIFFVSCYSAVASCDDFSSFLKGCVINRNKNSVRSFKTNSKKSKHKKNIIYEFSDPILVVNLF